MFCKNFNCIFGDAPQGWVGEKTMEGVEGFGFKFIFLM